MCSQFFSWEWQYEFYRYHKNDGCISPISKGRSLSDSLGIQVSKDGLPPGAGPPGSEKWPPRQERWNKSGRKIWKQQYPSFHNHWKMGVSPIVSSSLSNTAIFHWTMITGEGVSIKESVKNSRSSKEFWEKKPSFQPTQQPQKIPHAPVSSRGLASQLRLWESYQIPHDSATPGPWLHSDLTAWRKCLIDPDWRCMDPIKNGDIPACYVIVYQRVHFAQNGCQIGKKYINKIRPVRNTLQGYPYISHLEKRRIIIFKSAGWGGDTLVPQTPTARWLSPNCWAS